MRKKAPLQEVDPRALPVGTRVGPWRVLGFRGRGAYGTLYRVEREGREQEGSAALKLAVYPGDERYAREVWLLKRIRSPYVPRFHDEGVWEHATGDFPYVVMELVEGEPLYEWAGRRNPTEGQVLRLLAQVAHAIADTHEAGGLHRDVKGANVLVRLSDGRAFLTDFGAGITGARPRSPRSCCRRELRPTAAPRRGAF
jgi:serine/threonine protein kinase